METCNCKVYDGTLGAVHLKRKGGQGQGHRGWDIWRYPRTTVLDDVAVMAPMTVKPKFLGDANILGGDSWTWGLMACMLMVDGPHPGYYLLMAHFNGINIMGTEGQTLPVGTIIGCEGWTGNTIPNGAGGKHLHVEVVDANYNPMPSSWVADVLGFNPNAAEDRAYENTFRLNPAPPPEPEPTPAPSSRVGTSFTIPGEKTIPLYTTNQIASSGGDVIPNAFIGVKKRTFYIQEDVQGIGRVPVTWMEEYRNGPATPTTTTGYINVADIP